MKKYLFLLILVGLAGLGKGQAIQGAATDNKTGQPLENVIISLKNTPFSTITNQEGIFKFDRVKPGNYLLSAVLLGYSAQEIPVIITSESPADVNISLQPTIFLLNQSVVVTAQRLETDIFNRPEMASVVTAKELKQRAPRTVPEALFGTPGVFLQKTNHGGGSPFIRGLTGQQTLLLVDGIRVNNATFRSGPNQYLNTFDPQNIAQIEVLRGSGSVQYGSDALGGVAHLLTKTPQFTDHFQVGGSAFLKYTTADMEKSGRTEVNISNARVALLGGIAYRDFGDIKAGGDLGYLRPTGYTQLSGDLKARFRLSDNLLLTAAYQQLQQDSVPLYHRVQLENYQYAHFDPQQRQLAYLRAEGFYRNKWFRQVQLTGSFQRFLEGRQSRKNKSPTISTERDDIGTWGLTLMIHSEPGKNWHAQTGAEFYLDKVGSTRHDVLAATGATTPKRGLYPDGSEAASLALYSLHTFEWKKFTFTAGGRYNAYRIAVKDNTLGTSVIQPSTLVGNAGVTYAIHPNHRLVASINSAFRAPNIDDMGTLGIVDFRYELPNTSLRPEKALNYEVGWKARTNLFSASFAAYHNHLSNIISRIRAGSDSIMDYPVYYKENTAAAYIRGIEATAEIQIARSLAG